VRQYGELVRAASLDVTDPVAAGVAVQLAIDEFGALDIVVNNAGYAISAPIEEMTIDDFRAQIRRDPKAMGFGSVLCFCGWPGRRGAGCGS
jgi:NAD(P)-dependent dehydrogenase (short-subunit alcohol dehydrogenase family)